MDTPATAPTVTRPADAVEDPYVWQPVGAFGAQPVTARDPVAQAEPEKPALPTDATNSERTWRWRDFIVGLTFGALTVAVLSLVVNFERR